MANDTLFSGDSKLDSIVESFESAYVADVIPAIEDFLPDHSDPDFQEILLELLRVDMEYRWSSGDPKRLAEYLSQFESELSDPQLVTQLAFEEYRLRIESGESVTKASYQAYPNVSVADWPQESKPSIDDNDTMSVDQVSTDFESLPDSIAPFPDLGDRVAGFRILRQIGRGKFGRVFLAEQNSLSARLVVLKITTMKSIEPQRLAQLQHTNVVPIHSEHQVDNLQIVCMPYFGQTTLADVISEVRKSDLNEATGEVFRITFQRTSTDLTCDEEVSGSWLRICEQSHVDACIGIAIQIAEGLAHAHARGILHRDLKPANILLANDGRPLLLDFNLSEQIIPGGMASLLVGGTVPYMSPEQLRSLEKTEAIDRRSDIFSFGVVLYELLTGTRPFSDRTGENSIAAVLRERADYRPASELNRSIPPSICDVVAKCMAVDVSARYGRFEEIIADLNRHLEYRPLVHTPNRSLAERLAKWKKRNPRLLSNSSIAILACLLLMSVIGTLFLVQHNSRKALVHSQVRNIAESLPNLRVEIGSTDTSLDAIRAGEVKLKEAYDLLQIENAGTGDRLERFFRGDESFQLATVRREILFLLSHANERLARHAERVNDRRELINVSLNYNQQAAGIPGSEHDKLQFEHQMKGLRVLLDDAPSLSRLDEATNSEAGPSVYVVLNLLRQGLFDDAIPILEQMRKDNPLDFATWFHLGEAYYAVGQLDQAESCFSTCIVIWPDSPKAFLYRGICYLASKDFARAEKDFDGALALRSDWNAALYNRAISRRGLNKYGAAEADLNQIVQKDEATPRVLFLRSQVRKRLDDIEGAKADSQLAMSLPPIDFRDYIARGMAQLHSDPQAALQDFSAAIRLNPGSRKAMRNSIYVLTEKIKDAKAALVVAENLVERLGETADDLMSVAVLKARLGEIDDAEAISKRALQIREDGKICFQVACVYALANDTKYDSLALTQLRQAVRLEPKWLTRLSDPDLGSIRSHPDFRELVVLAAAYRKTVENLK